MPDISFPLLVINPRRISSKTYYDVSKTDLRDLIFLSEIKNILNLC